MYYFEQMRHRVRKFIVDRRGVSAIEAAMLAPVFLPVLVFCFELLMFMFTSSSMDNAMRRTVQELRLGVAQSTALAKNWTAKEYYRRQICSHMFVANCENKIQVSIETYDSTGVQTAVFDDQFAPANTLVYLEAQVEVPMSAFMRLAADDEGVIVKASQLIMTEPF